MDDHHFTHESSWSTADEERTFLRVRDLLMEMRTRGHGIYIMPVVQATHGVDGWAVGQVSADGREGPRNRAVARSGGRGCTRRCELSLGGAAVAVARARPGIDAAHLVVLGLVQPARSLELVTRGDEEVVPIATDLFVFMQGDHHDRVAVGRTALAEHRHAGVESQPLRLLGNTVVRRPCIQAPPISFSRFLSLYPNSHVSSCSG